MHQAYLLDGEVSYELHMKTINRLLHLVSKELSSLVEHASYLFHEILTKELVLMFLFGLRFFLLLFEVFPV